MVNKLFYIKFKEYDYDEYAGYVYCAETKEEAIELAGIRKTKEEAKSDYYDNTNEYLDNIESITIIGIASEDVKKGCVISDFRAG